jgi:putative Ca2+/H+ antiporter (TMEM165/GDT1 family)
VDPYVALVTFPLVFLGELPDKTMFANLIMATRGRPRQVWLGAAGAFAVHVAIAVTVGAALFALLPRRVVDALVAAMFAAGAVYAWWEGRRPQGERVSSTSAHSAVLTAFAVIFVAEWGDLTQIVIADLAAKYHSPFSVAVGALAALLVVAAGAVGAGQRLLRHLDVSTVRKVTAVVLGGLAAYSTWSALS